MGRSWTQLNVSFCYQASSPHLKMYAAHAKKQKEETSKSQLNECLALIKAARSDNDKFAALLEITQGVWSESFTDGDRSTALQAFDQQLLLDLLSTNNLQAGSRNDLYKSIALSILAVLSVDVVGVKFAQNQSTLSLVRDVLAQNASKKPPSVSSHHKRMCRDCEEILFNISQTDGGTRCLVDNGIAQLILDYSPYSQHQTHVLSCVGAVMQHEGDFIYLDIQDKLNNAISMIVDKIGKGQSLTEKMKYAKILTAMLLGFSMIEITVSTSWVVPLALSLQKLLLFKLYPDDNERLLSLVQAFVSAVGPKVLDPEVTGSFQLLKAVVAHVTVEIYMLLDGIDTETATERYSRLDGMYKLMSSAVQCIANLGDDADPDSVIVLYKKLVDTRDTIIEFLYSVADQDLALPRNHSVVLISVRALAALLTEISEEPSQHLLRLLPFFNFLCQPVEYEDDVIMEVKNATQAALENIKMMGMMSIEEVIEEGNNEQKAERGENRSAPADGNAQSKTRDSLKSTIVSYSKPDRVSNKDTGKDSLSPSTQRDSPGPSDDNLKIKTNYRTYNTPTQITSGIDYNKLNGDVSDDLSSSSTKSSSQQDACDTKTKVPEDADTRIDQSKNPSPNVARVIHLSLECIEDFKAFQESVSSYRDKPESPNSAEAARRVSFSSRGGKKCQKLSLKNGPTQPLPWTPGPDDVLGFLLPAYMFLIDCDEALRIMVDSDSFQIVVNFLQRALTQLLEEKSGENPETMTTNGLDLVYQLYDIHPETALRLHCFQDLFEIFVLSVPNLANMMTISPLICLKVMKTSLEAYRLHTASKNNNALLTRLRHSHSRFFKAVVEYLKSAYEIRQHKRKPPTLVIAGNMRDVWVSAKDSWLRCVQGIEELAAGSEELQDVLIKSSFLAEFLTFIRDSEVSSLDDFPEETNFVVGSLLPIVRESASTSDKICELVLYYKGLDIAWKFGIDRLRVRLMEYATTKGVRKFDAMMLNGES